MKVQSFVSYVLPTDLEDKPRYTTLAVGEEGGQVDEGVVTTQAIGEEGGQVGQGVVTTQAIGEEGGQVDQGFVTTQALGEEGGQTDVGTVTTQALGEECGGPIGSVGSTRGQARAAATALEAYVNERKARLTRERDPIDQVESVTVLRQRGGGFALDVRFSASLSRGELQALTDDLRRVLDARGYANVRLSLRPELTMTTLALGEESGAL